MNKTRIIFLALIVISLRLDMLAHGQGTFRNLDFGMSQVPSSTPPNSIVGTDMAFPFWTAYIDTSQLSSVRYNGVNIGSAGVSLLATNSSFGPTIPGLNTAVLQAGIQSLSFVPASMAQTGTLPADAMSLLFVASPPYGQGWTVTIGSETIPVTQGVQVAQNLFLYQGNISAFAGQTEELRFTALAGDENVYFGDIQFSPIAVPEPTVAALLAVAGLIIVLRAVRRKT